MAKTPKNTKKSRFGNPAKAAADAAARTVATSSGEARLERAMEALAPGFVAWLESQGRPDKSIDLSLLIVDDFFDMYRIVEPHVDPTALVPAALHEVLAVMHDANPLGVMGMRSGVRDYVTYLGQARLWTGTPEDLAAVLELCNQLDGGDAADADADADYDATPTTVFLPALSRSELLATIQASPLWQNTRNLLAWLGEGRELTAEGTLADTPESLAALAHSGIGALAGAAALQDPTEAASERLALYWELLNVAGLAVVVDNHFRPTPAAGELGEEEHLVLAMRELVSHYIYIATLEGSEEGEFEQWHLDMVDWLTWASSAEPPAAQQLIEALADPDAADPQLLAIAQNVAQWAQEGLVTVGEFIEVPAAWRPDVVDMLQDDFALEVTGPGADAA